MLSCNTQSVSNSEDSPGANICTASFLARAVVSFSADENPHMSHAPSSFSISHKACLIIPQPWRLTRKLGSLSLLYSRTALPLLLTSFF